MIADLEKIAADYIRTNSAVHALTTRVVSKTPDTTTTAWVRTTTLDARDDARSNLDHLITYLVQFDCYSGATGGKPEASALARTVRAALKAMPGKHDGAIITRVAFTGHIRIPDTALEPARERFIVTAEIRAHS